MPWHALDPGSAPLPIVVRLAGVDVLLGVIDGVWFAVEDRCSHADCSFSSDGEVDGSTLVCNCHGSEFDARTGERLVAPAERPIRTFSVRERHGGLEVEL